MAQVQQAGVPILLSSSGIVSKVGGQLIGYSVASTTSGTIVFFEGTTAGGTAVSGTITPPTGFSAFPCTFQTGCFVTLGGTISVTFFFSAG